MGGSTVPLAQATSKHGGKAVNLARLIGLGYRVPDGVVVDSPGASGLEAWLEPEKSYAVRSSASVEDSPEHSFAGQFTTELGVEGIDAIGQAIETVIASATDERIAPYLEHSGVAPADVRMHVIVQEMVAASVSGVAFSRNPLTGLADVLIESVPGTGDTLVSGTASPQRWIRHWGDWTQRPETPHLPEAVAIELADLVAKVADELDGPSDIEWAWDGMELYLLQVRPMTAANVVVYSNRLAKEFLPGMITPLVWSINVPLVNSAWLDLFTSLVGDLDLEPDDLSRQFAYRAYFNMSVVGDIFEAMSMPRDLLEVLAGLEGGHDRPGFKPSMGVVRHIPRMVRMAWRLSRYHREVDRLIPQVDQDIARIESQDVTSISDRELVDRIATIEIVTHRVALANIISPLLFNAYGSLLRRRLQKRGFDAQAINIGAGDPALDAYDPTPHIKRLSAEIAQLEGPVRERALQGELAAVPGGEAFLERFGHVSDSGNDFSRVPWREDPSQLAPLLTVSDALGDEGNGRGGAAKVASTPHLGGLDGVLARRTARYRLERERVSHTYTRSYGLFRSTVMEVSARLVDRGQLDEPDHVFALARHEMEAGLLDPARPDLRPTADPRRSEMAQLADVEMPEVIFGDEFVPAPPTDPDHRLVGVPSSRGVRRARACVVTGLNEAGGVEPGDVVIVPYSDVAWTPLLSRAGAIVAESGGLLSHSSIVAREFGIPCVVSVSGAMRIPDGSVVRVDGFTGDVHWEPV